MHRAPKARHHDLRHTAATVLLEAGVHPKLVLEEQRLRTESALVFPNRDGEPTESSTWTRIRGSPARASATLSAAVTQPRHPGTERRGREDDGSAVRG